MLLLVGEVQVLEDRRRHEVLNTVETLPSCRKPKPRTWSPDARAAGDAEHADLLIEVAQVGDLELLRLALERRQAVGAERQAVAELTGDRAAIRVAWLRKRFCPCRLVRVVATSSSARIGFGGSATVRMKSVNACISPVRQLRAAAEQAHERRVERLERQLLVERRPARSSSRCDRRASASGRHPPCRAGVCVVMGPFMGWKAQSDTRCPRPVRRR